MKLNPTRRDYKLKALFGIFAILIAAALAIGVWWGHFILRQSRKIEELERLQGLSTDGQATRTAMMVIGEASVLLFVLVACMAGIFWLYLRDLKRVKALHAFFASVTHELRTPLTSIRLQAESLADDLVLSRETSSGSGKLLGRLLEDTTRLEGQVERTLELARVEGGGKLRIQPVSLKAQVDKVSQLFESGINLRVELENAWVNGDVGAIQTVLKNIFDNALRHSGVEFPLMEVCLLRTAHSPGRVGLVLRNHGTGPVDLDAEKFGKLFEKGKSSSGAGVGLYLVKNLMIQMGGSVQFEERSAGFGLVLWFSEAHHG